jgi:hypothetical protein
MAKCLAIFLRLTTTPTAKPMSAALMPAAQPCAIPAPTSSPNTNTSAAIAAEPRLRLRHCQRRL